MKKYNYIFIAFVTAVCLFVGYASWGYPKQDISLGYGPSFYPLMLVGIILALCAILFFQTMFGKGVSDDKIAGMDWKTLKKPVSFLAAMVLFSLLLPVVGLWVDAFLFLLAGMLIMKLQIIKAALASAIASTILYSLFVVLLKVPFPMGILFGG